MSRDGINPGHAMNNWSRDVYNLNVNINLMYLIGTNFHGEKFSRGQIFAGTNFAGIYFRELAQIRENKTLLFLTMLTSS